MTKLSSITDFIRFTGSLVGNGSAAPHPDFCRQAVSNGAESLFFYFCKDALPESYRDNFRQKYLNGMIDAMRQERGLKELSRMFEEEHIRFTPIKGADLAFRVYPSPALRFFTDWDILIHPNDCERALNVLKANGWSAPYAGALAAGHHHYVRHYKDDWQLEPHWTLPHFDGVDPHELWQYIHPVDPSGFRHVLSPELNLLMLTRHAAAGDYMHISLVKLLLDIGFLLKKESVDWALLHSMADNWRLPRPDNLLGAWPEFFPPEILEKMEIDRTASAAYRELFLQQEQYTKYESVEWAMNRPDTFSADWFKTRFSVFRKNTICAKHHLPEDAAATRIARAYLQEAIFKGYNFCRFLFRPNRRISERLRLIRKAEARHEH